MAELAERFKTEVAERLGEVERLLVLAESGPDQAEAIESIRDHAHKLKGAAGMFGQEELKGCASELEVLASGVSNGASLRPAVTKLELAAQAV